MGKFQLIYRRRILISFLLLVVMQPTNAGFFFSPAIHFPFFFCHCFSPSPPTKISFFWESHSDMQTPLPTSSWEGGPPNNSDEWKNPSPPRPSSNYCIVFLITTHPAFPPPFICAQNYTLFLFGGPHCHRFCFFWGRGRGVIFLGGPKGGRRGGGGPDSSSFPTELLITFSTLYLPG